MPDRLKQPPAPLRILVADDQEIVRDGLATVLALLEGLEVVGTAADGQEAVELAATTRPDVVLMDLRMPRMDGAEATAAILADQPGVAVLVLTTHDDDASVARALRAGARGYLTKDASRDDIAVALRAVARGQSTFDPAVGARLVSALADAEPPAASDQADARLVDLTAREREILRLIGSGLTNAEIADQLYVSTSTVKTHINNLFAKLHLRDRVHAARLAAEVFGPGPARENIAPH